jgi:hypothetical protein
MLRGLPPAGPAGAMPRTPFLLLNKQVFAEFRGGEATGYGVLPANP